MTWAEYRRMTEEKAWGRRVQTTRVIGNRLVELPVGTKGTIHRKWKGFEVTFDPCSQCRVRPTISRISPIDLMLLPKED